MGEEDALDTDAEADALSDRIPGAIEVRGSMRPDVKEERIISFSTGQITRLITKSSICGWGLNWQHCARQAFVGMNFSWESYYQAVRRCWRFGQTRPVDVHIAMSETEVAIWDAITRKQADHDDMQKAMTESMKRAHQSALARATYTPICNVSIPTWMVAA